jgi:hypothetical protein
MVVMRLFVSPFALVAVAVSAVGCGPGSYGDLREGLVGSACAWAEKCGYVDATDRADCPLDQVLTIFGDSAAMRAAPDAVDVEGSVHAGRMRYDSVDAASCEHAVKTAPCDPTLAARARLSGCNAVVEPSTSIGKLCYGDLECTGAVCVHDAGCAGVCVVYAPFGAPCDPNDANPPIASRCDPTVGFCGAVTEGAQPVCQHTKPKGSACTATTECDFGWDCRLGKCVTPIELGVGEACGGDDPCGAGKFCDPTTLLCAKQGARAAACVAPFGCKDGLACIGLVPVAQTGTPTPVVTPGVCGAWLPLGAACTAGAPGAVTGCPSLSSTCTGGVCTKKAHDAALGESCETESCAVGLACNKSSVCDFLVGGLGNCSGASATLCEPGLSCDTSSTDRDRCTPPNPPACYTMPNLDMLNLDALESVD